MNIQEIIDRRFTSYIEAVNYAGGSDILIALLPNTPIRPLPCNFKDDMINPVASKVKYTTIRLRLTQYTDGWRFVNIGEV